MSKESEKYFSAKGGRKTATAVTRLFNKKGSLLINNKDYKNYFKGLKNQIIVEAPLELLKLKDKISASIKVFGGGLNGQAEAVRNSLAKALVEFKPEFKNILRQAGFITRDSRMVERKKYGLKKARRAPQWAKR